MKNTKHIEESDLKFKEMREKITKQRQQKDITMEKRKKDSIDKDSEF